MGDNKFEVEVAYALPERQRIVRLRVAPGATARQAVLRSGLDAEFPGLNLQTGPIGIFGFVVSDDHALQVGDRVELYRPLCADPREARRARVEQLRHGRR
jgi:putative ubiquitin-RnfH superfamily antitoxin RatB of RatAB toxin-antitoxin module